MFRLDFHVVLDEVSYGGLQHFFHLFHSEILFLCCSDWLDSLKQNKGHWLTVGVDELLVVGCCLIGLYGLVHRDHNLPNHIAAIFERGLIQLICVLGVCCRQSIQGTHGQVLHEIVVEGCWCTECSIF